AESFGFNSELMRRRGQRWNHVQSVRVGRGRPGEFGSQLGRSYVRPWHTPAIGIGHSAVDAAEALRVRTCAGHAKNEKGKHEILFHVSIPPRKSQPILLLRPPCTPLHSPTIRLRIRTLGRNATLAPRHRHSE